MHSVSSIQLWIYSVFSFSLRYLIITLALTSIIFQCSEELRGKSKSQEGTCLYLLTPWLIYYMITNVWTQWKLYPELLLVLFTRRYAGIENSFKMAVQEDIWHDTD